MIAEYHEGEFYMIFHFMAAKNWIAEYYDVDFDMIFHFMVARNLFAEHYVSVLDMISLFIAAKNLVAEYCLRDFDMIFYFETSSLKTWLQSTMKKDRLTGLALAFMAMDKNISWTCLLPLNFKQPLKKILRSAPPPPPLTNSCIRVCMGLLLSNLR